MIDIKAFRADPEGTRRSLERRRIDLSDLDALAAADEAWRKALAAQEESRAEIKSLSREVAARRKAGDEATVAELAELSRTVGERESRYAAEATAAEARRRELLLSLPNLPSPDCPDGAGPQDNPVVKWWAPFPLGSDPETEVAAHFAEAQRVPHWEVGAALGILDMERGAKLSGSMFPMFRGSGARLVRALVSWALSRHGEPGPYGSFEEIRPPTLVLTDTMTSTGHLPKFADDAYHLERDDLWAIPTAEVPLTSLGRDEILSGEDLPMLLAAHSSCFRREAGSAGRDTRGLLRVHEFDKVEILALCRPDQATALHEELMRRAETLVADLGLAYRVVDLCAGDLGSSAARTFDIEVYAPGCDMWLEVSSVSWFSDYQARRANVRFRAEGSKELAFVNTLNGSAVAVPRIWAAIVETYRREDGSVTVPEVLRPFMGGQEVIEASAC